MRRGVFTAVFTAVHTQLPACTAGTCGPFYISICRSAEACCRVLDDTRREPLCGHAWYQGHVNIEVSEAVHRTEADATAYRSGRAGAVRSSEITAKARSLFVTALRPAAK